MPKTQSATVELSDAQLVVLSAAAKRADGSLLPFPQNLTIKGAALSKAVETLCKRKLVEEKGIVTGAPEWRRDEERRPLGLFITESGRLALGIDETEEARPAQAAASLPSRRKTRATKRSKTRKTSSTKPGGQAASSQSKQDVVLQLLRRRSGVTVEDISAETGWQPHSVRGFFSGLVKKKLKLPLTSEVGKDGVRRYHIAPLASAKA